VPHIDAEHRGAAGSAHELGCAQDRAVAPEDDGELEVVDVDVVAQYVDA
jgi:hypothetical protein